MAEAADPVNWILFFFCLYITCQAPILQIGTCHHHQQCVMVQTQPGSALVMVQAKLVLELLTRLLACPAAFIAGTRALRGVLGGWLVK